MPETIDAALIYLIGTIYDAVIDPQLWLTALDNIREHFDFQMAALSAHDRLRGAGFLQLTSNMPEHYLNLIGKFGNEALEVWGGAARLASFPLEEPVLTSQVTNQAAWEKLAYYREWVQPQGLVDQVGIILARDRLVFGALGLSVHRSRPPVTETVLDQLRLLAPHLSRAVAITRLLDEARLSAATFQGALDATSAGVVLVAADMRIIHANHTAAAMLELGDPVRESDGRLHLREEFVPGQLSASVTAISRDESAAGRRGMGVPARLRDGTPMAINVMPLERRLVRAGVSAEASAALFIGDAAAPINLPADAMRLLFNLTPAEERVFTLVVDGRGTDDIAQHLGVLPSTVRTHLLSIFNKTGVHTRGDLQLLARDIRLPG